MNTDALGPMDPQPASIDFRDPAYSHIVGSGPEQASQAARASSQSSLENVSAEPKGDNITKTSNKAQSVLKNMQSGVKGLGTSLKNNVENISRKLPNLGKVDEFTTPEEVKEIGKDLDELNKAREEKRYNKKELEEDIGKIKGAEVKLGELAKSAPSAKKEMLIMAAVVAAIAVLIIASIFIPGFPALLLMGGLLVLGVTLTAANVNVDVKSMIHESKENIAKGEIEEVEKKYNEDLKAENKGKKEPVRIKQFLEGLLAKEQSRESEEEIGDRIHSANERSKEVANEGDDVPLEVRRNATSASASTEGVPSGIATDGITESEETNDDYLEAIQGLLFSTEVLEQNNTQVDPSSSEPARPREPESVRFEGSKDDQRSFSISSGSADGHIPPLSASRGPEQSIDSESDSDEVGQRPSSSISDREGPAKPLGPSSRSASTQIESETESQPASSGVDAEDSPKFNPPPKGTPSAGPIPVQNGESESFNDDGKPKTSTINLENEEPTGYEEPARFIEPESDRLDEAEDPSSPISSENEEPVNTEEFTEASSALEVAAPVQDEVSKNEEPEDSEGVREAGIDSEGPASSTESESVNDDGEYPPKVDPAPTSQVSDRETDSPKPMTAIRIPQKPNKKNKSKASDPYRGI